MAPADERHVDDAPARRLPAQLRIGDDSAGGLVTDGFVVPPLGSPSDTPPAYGAHHDHVQFSQPGFEAGAAVTGACRRPAAVPG